MSTSARNSRSKAYWLVTTEHLKKGLWFRDDEDYRVGMNYVAIVAFVYKVMVLAFVLMSNHVHFVLYCTEEEARAFINEFKADCSRHLALKYGVRDLLRRNRVVIERITMDSRPREPSWETCPGMQSVSACVPSGLFQPIGSSERMVTSFRNPMCLSSW